MATAAHQPITAQTLDTDIWRDGFAHGGGELDFLRAIHRRHNVQQLARFLRQQHPGLPIRVTSIWLDKFPICEPTSAGATRTTRELGDLGIAVRRRSVGGTPASRFWILQGKVNGPSWQTQGESPKEIELYETCPAFDLYTSGHKKHKLGSFDLAGGGGGKGFGTPVKKTGFPFWNFLMFDPPVAQAGPLCMAHCWDSGGAHQASFAAGISAMVQRLGVDDDDHGARVDAGTRYPEWKRLYEVLFRHSSRASTGRLSGATPRWPFSSWRMCSGRRSSRAWALHSGHPTNRSRSSRQAMASRAGCLLWRCSRAMNGSERRSVMQCAMRGPLAVMRRHPATARTTAKAGCRC
jgi:hypothetical protein